jgi:hypothetical protein
MEEITNQEAIDHMVEYLKSQKVKNIEVEGGSIQFDFKGVSYHLYIEGPEDVHFSIFEMDGVNLGPDFWEYKTEFESYTYIEDYFENVVKSDAYSFIRKAWKALEKLEEADESDDLPQIAASYFGMF